MVIGNATTQRGLVNTPQSRAAKVNAVKHQILALETPEPTNLAYAIANSRHLLFNYLMDNNLNSLNGILMLKLGEKVAFLPDRRQIETIIAGYIANNEKQKIQTLLDNFKFNEMAANYTTNEAMRKEIAKQIKQNS